MEDLRQVHKKKEISIVIPVYNAENHILTTVQEINKQCKDLDFELILVDDGSKDGTWAKLKSIKRDNDEIKIIRLSRNFGQHNTTMCGIKEATGNYIVTIDDDLEDEPSIIIELYNKIKSSDVDIVYAMNKAQSKGIGRRILTYVYKNISKLEGIQKGKGSSFRIMTRALAKNVVDSSSKFVFIDEVCLWYTEKIAHINYKSKSKGKKSRYRKSDLFGLAGNVIMFSSTLPLRLVTTVGFAMASVNFIIGIIFIFRKFFHNVPVGYTSILISVLFGSGLILMALGIIGEYVGKMLKLLHRSPVYEIREKE